MVQQDNEIIPIEEDENYAEAEASFEERLLEVVTSKLEDGDLPPEYLKLSADLVINMPIGKEEIRARCFHLIGSSVVFGICIAETHDSFLIATPAVLTSSEGSIEAKAIGASNVIRMLKSGISFVSVPFDEHRYYYLRWIKRKHKYACDIFTPERRELIEKMLYTYENRNISSEVDTPEKESATGKEGRSRSDVSSDSFWITSDGKTRH